MSQGLLERRKPTSSGTQLSRRKVPVEEAKPTSAGSRKFTTDIVTRGARNVAPFAPKEVIAAIIAKRKFASEATSGGRVHLPAKAPAATWYRDSVCRIRQIRQLGSNWDSYGAQAPNRWAAYWAERILDALRLLHFEPSWVNPSAEGGILIAFRRGRRFGSIECYNSGSIVGVTSDGQGNVDAWRVAIDERALADAIRKIGRFLDGRSS